MAREDVNARLFDLQETVYPHYPTLLKKFFERIRRRAEGMSLLQVGEYLLKEFNVTLELEGFPLNIQSTVFVSNHPSWFLDVPALIMPVEKILIHLNVLHGRNSYRFSIASNLSDMM